MTSYQLSTINSQLPEGYKQTEVGVVPADWDVPSFRSLYAEASRNGIYKSAEHQGRGVRIINMGEMFGLDFISDQEMNRISLTKRELAITRLRDGDLLFGRRSVVPSGAGKCSIVVKPSEPMTFESSIIRVRLNALEVVPLFYYYYFSSSLGRKVMGNIISGTNIKGIRASELQELLVPQPPPLEQKAIATTLSDVDALIAALDRLIAKKRDLKTGMMQELLTGKRRLPGFGEGKGDRMTEVGRIPDDWDVQLLGSLASIQRGASPRPIASPVWFDRNSLVGWVRISDVTRSGMYLHETEQKLSPLGIQHSRPVAKGSLIMSICATVGRPIITEIDVCIHDGFVVFDNLQTEQLFMYYVLKWIEPSWSNQGQTGSQMNLNTELINSTVFCLPSAPEQKAIATVLSDIDTEITTLEQRRNKTRDLKQAMMQELLTGRTRLV